ncbi:MAG TPA: hypothetical protein VF310_05190 [Vicinamibacteria bacterium]
MTSGARLRLAAALAAGLAAGGALAAEHIARFTAFAVDTSNATSRTRAGVIEITIDRWSTDQDRDQLLAALRESGSDGLLKALQKIKDPVGYIRTPESIGYPLRFAREVPNAEGGKRVIVATDRPIGFLEATRRPRTFDYPFMIVDLRIDAKGEGQGKLMPLARITANDEHVVEIENYANEPVRLTQVKQASK